MNNQTLKGFKNLSYVLDKSKRVLLVAHSAPDGDTTGSVLALSYYLEKIGIMSDIACFDDFPEFLKSLSQKRFTHPSKLNLNSYDTIIGCDSVDRGFKDLTQDISENIVTVILDHHPDIESEADILINNPQKSSVCEIIYDFLVFRKAEIGNETATSLMIGLISDTGNFQHANTTARVMEISSDLMKKGASFSKIISSSIANKKISTLKLWGIAFEKAKINPENGMIYTILTKKDIESCKASTEDISQVASILNTVPETKFSLVLTEKDENTIKGSLRSEEYKGVDVSKIAQKFGGGGHKLASGFTVKGKIIENQKGFNIV